MRKDHPNEVSILGSEFSWDVVWLIGFRLGMCREEQPLTVLTRHGLLAAVVDFGASDVIYSISSKE